MPDQPVLLAVSHGTGSPAGRGAVGSLVAAVAATATAPVRGGFVDVQPPRLPRLIGGLPDERGAVIVPLLLSAGYHVRVDIARAAAAAGRPVAVAEALGPDDGLVALLAARLAAAGATRRHAVVVAAAGSSDAGAVEDCRETARRLGALLGRPVSVGFLSAAEPRLPAAVAAARDAAPGQPVAIATYLLAPGYFFDLVRDAGADVVAEPLLHGRGAPPAAVVRAVLDRYAAAASRLEHEPLSAPAQA